MRTLFVGVILWLLGSSVGAQTPVLLIGAEDDWAPYSSAENGQPKGMAVDIVQAIFAQAKLPVELVSMPYDRCMAEAKAGRLAGCFDTVPDAQMRRDYIFHAKPLFSDFVAILMRKDSPVASMQLRDLENKSVIVTYGYTYGEEFEGNKKIQRMDAIGDINVLRMLKAGKGDQAIVYSRILSHLMRGKGKDMEGAFKVVGRLPENPLYLTFSRRWPDITEVTKRFNAAHDQLLKSGAIAAIEKRWD